MWAMEMEAMVMVGGGGGGRGIISCAELSTHPFTYQVKNPVSSKSRWEACFTFLT